MSAVSCDRRCRCAVLTVIASIIVGVASAFLQVTGTITAPLAFFWVTFGIAVWALVLTSAAAPTVRRISECVIHGLSLLLIGALGTIASSLILIAFAFAATSMVGAIFVGIMMFFFTMTLAGTACYTKHLVTDNE